MSSCGITVCFVTSHMDTDIEMKRMASDFWNCQYSGIPSNEPLGV